MQASERQRCEEEWFNSCPAGLLLADSGGGVCRINPILKGLLGCAAEDLPPSECSELLGAEERIRIVDGAGRDRWFQRQAEPVAVTGSGEQRILYCFQDITEQVQLQAECDRLRRQVHELTLTDELTGLANRRALMNALNAQVTRSRRYHNPLSLVLVQVELGDDKTQAIHELPERAVLAVSHYLRDRLRWADIIGRYDAALFMLILPETAKQAGATLIHKIKSEKGQIELPEDLAGIPLRLHFGLADWQQGDDPQVLIERALDAMPKPQRLAASAAGQE